MIWSRYQFNFWSWVTVDIQTYPIHNDVIFVYSCCDMRTKLMMQSPNERFWSIFYEAASSCYIAGCHDNLPNLCHFPQLPLAFLNSRRSGYTGRCLQWNVQRKSLHSVWHVESCQICFSFILCILKYLWTDWNKLEKFFGNFTYKITLRPDNRICIILELFRNIRWTHSGISVA